ncbi:GtrA family protein [Serratia odorifera]|uniref:GtrA family protein n=1 Tax=Serratia odorifera TaxID=618 RepID=UPI000586F118|nr:GtrA family protein [Serratia odorifera]PNK89144.1 GtrA family protein [Serratia odorifera]RII69826.1 GtrA family protein [Serratia odorifera]
MNTFLRYASVGVMNTCAHWAVFALMLLGGSSQSISNVVAFCIAVTISFFVNARWTFKSEATTIRYVMYVLFMGGMAFLVGWLADKMDVKPIITLITFSAVSLICGFIYSKFFVFKDN